MCIIHVLKSALFNRYSRASSYVEHMFLYVHMPYHMLDTCFTHVKHAFYISHYLLVYFFMCLRCAFNVCQIYKKYTCVICVS